MEYFVKLNAARNKNEDDPSDDESMLSDEEIRRNGINMQGNFSVKLHNFKCYVNIKLCDFTENFVKLN